METGIGCDVHFAPQSRSLASKHCDPESRHQDQFTRPVEPLSPRIEKFIVERLGGLLLDEIQGSEERRADYVCLRGLLAVEIKSLEDDGSERLDNLLEELRSAPDWPIFLGSAPMQSFIDNTDDPEAVGHKVMGRVGRGILNPLKKANRQLKAHAKAFPRKAKFEF